MGFKCLGYAMFVILTMSMVYLFHCYMNNSLDIVRVTSPVEFTTITVENEPFINSVAEELSMTPRIISKRSTSSSDLSKTIESNLTDSPPNYSKELAGKKSTDRSSVNIETNANNPYSESNQKPKSNSTFERLKPILLVEENKKVQQKNGIVRIKVRNISQVPSNNRTKREDMNDKNNNNKTKTLNALVKGLDDRKTFEDVANSTLSRRYILSTTISPNVFSSIGNVTAEIQNFLENCSLDWNQIQEIEFYLQVYERLKAKLESENSDNNLPDNNGKLKKEEILLLDSLEKNITDILSKGEIIGTTEENNFHPSTTETSLKRSVEGTPKTDVSKDPTISILSGKYYKPITSNPPKSSAKAELNSNKNIAVKNSTRVVENNRKYRPHDLAGKRKSFIFNRNISTSSLSALNANSFNLLDSSLKMGSFVSPEPKIQLSGETNNNINLTDLTLNVTQNNESINRFDGVKKASLSDKSINNTNIIVNGTMNSPHIKKLNEIVNVKSIERFNNTDTFKIINYLNNLDEMVKTTPNIKMNNPKTTTYFTLDNYHQRNNLDVIVKPRLKTNNQNMSSMNQELNNTSDKAFKSLYEKSNARSNDTKTEYLNKIESISNPENFSNATPSGKNIEQDEDINATLNKNFKNLDEIVTKSINNSNSSKPEEMANINMSSMNHDLKNTSNITFESLYGNLNAGSNDTKTEYLNKALQAPSIESTSIQEVFSKVTPSDKNIEQDEDINAASNKNFTNLDEIVTKSIKNINTNKLDRMTNNNSDYIDSVKITSNENINNNTTTINNKLDYSNVNNSSRFTKLGLNDKTINDSYSILNASPKYKNLNAKKSMKYDSLNLRFEDYQDTGEELKITPEKKGYKEIDNFSTKGRTIVKKNNNNTQELDVEEPFIQIKNSVDEIETRNLTLPVYSFLTEYPIVVTKYGSNETKENESENTTLRDEIKKIKKYLSIENNLSHMDNTEGLRVNTYPDNSKYPEKEVFKTENTITQTHKKEGNSTAQQDSETIKKDHKTIRNLSQKDYLEDSSTTSNDSEKTEKEVLKIKNIFPQKTQIKKDINSEETEQEELKNDNNLRQTDKKEGANTIPKYYEKTKKEDRTTENNLLQIINKDKKGLNTARKDSEVIEKLMDYIKDDNTASYDSEKTKREVLKTINTIPLTYSIENTKLASKKYEKTEREELKNKNSVLQSDNKEDANTIPKDYEEIDKEELRTQHSLSKMDNKYKKGTDTARNDSEVIKKDLITVNILPQIKYIEVGSPVPKDFKETKKEVLKIGNTFPPTKHSIQDTTNTETKNSELNKKHFKYENILPNKKEDNNNNNNIPNDYKDIKKELTTENTLSLTKIREDFNTDLKNSKDMEFIEKDKLNNDKANNHKIESSFKRNGSEKSKSETRHRASKQGFTVANPKSKDTETEVNILEQEPIKSRLNLLLNKIVYHPKSSIKNKFEDSKDKKEFSIKGSKLETEDLVQNVHCKTLSPMYSDSEEYENMLQTLHDVHFNSNIDKGMNGKLNKFKREFNDDIPCKNKRKTKKTTNQVKREESEEVQMEDDDQENSRDFISPKKVGRKNSFLTLKNKLRREKSEQVQDEEESSEELENTANLITPILKKKISPKSIVPPALKIKPPLKVAKPVKTDLRALSNKKYKKLSQASKYEQNISESSDSEEDLNENGLPDIVYIPFKNSNNLDVKSLLLLSNALSKGESKFFQQTPDVSYQGGTNNHYYRPTNPVPANYLEPTHAGFNFDNSYYNNLPQYSREQYDQDINIADRYWDGKRKRKVYLEDEEEPLPQQRKSFFNIEEPTREIANIVKSFSELSKAFKKSKMYS